MSIKKSTVKNLFDSVPENMNSIFPVINYAKELFPKISWQSGNFTDLKFPYYFGERQCTVSSFPVSSKKVTLQKVLKGKSVFENNTDSWSLLSSSARVAKVLSFLKEAEDLKSKIVALISFETAKNLFEAEHEFNRAVDYVKKSCKAFLDMDKNITYDKYYAYSKPSPLGVVFCSGPSNYPLFETWSVIFPALLCGNSVIVKLPGIGSLIHVPFLSLFDKCFPEGSIDFVAGDFKDTIVPALKSGDIDLFSYIGRGKNINQFLEKVKEKSSLRTVLGLEAKNPAVVFSDADLDKAAKNIVFGALNFNGQRCAAIKIVFAHKSIKERLVRKISDLVSELKIGLPWINNPDITPLLSLNSADYIESLLNDALNKNGSIVNEFGGLRNKNFVFPAVLDDVNEKMDIYKKEQFGPIIPVVSFSDFDKVLDYLNSSEYSQQISVFKKEYSPKDELFNILRKYSCRINVNSFCTRSPDVFPFAVKRHSGNFMFSVESAFKHFSVESIVVTKEE